MKMRGVWFASLVAVMATSMFLGAGCTPDYPKCEKDEHCKDKGEFCVDGTCRKCRDDKDCGGNLCVVCEGSTYTCERKAKCCTTDADCPGGRCWLTQGKQTGECGPSCRTDADCGPKQMCKEGGCVDKPICTTDAECGPNQRCVNNVCVDKPACNLSNIYFDYDESKITEDAKTTLQQNAECIKTRGGSIKIEGHCDERGTAEYNLALGERRANAAKDYLTNSGVSAGSLSTVSYGKERPVCSESNEDCWKRNRRAVFLFQ